MRAEEANQHAARATLPNHPPVRSLVPSRPSGSRVVAAISAVSRAISDQACAGADGAGPGLRSAGACTIGTSTKATARALAVERP